MPELSTGLIEVFVKMAKSAKVNENLSGNLRSLENYNFLKRGQAATCVRLLGSYCQEKHRRRRRQFISSLFFFIRSFLNRRNAIKREGKRRRLFFKKSSLAKQVQDFKESRAISFSESKWEKGQTNT